MEALTYPDALIARILRTVNTIAMVGASTNWNRPSYFVMKYLQGKGYRVIPVNPGAAGQQLLGETVRGSLSEITEPVDMVEIFRRSDAVPADCRRSHRHGNRWCGCNWAFVTTPPRPRPRRPG